MKIALAVGALLLAAAVAAREPIIIVDPGKVSRLPSAGIAHPAPQTPKAPAPKK